METKKLWKKIDGDWIIQTTNILSKSISTLYDIVVDGDSIPYTDVDYTQLNDLINLTMLNEPYILEAIHKRYNNDDIYTNCGNILLSVNPFKYTKLYSNEYKSKYATAVDSTGNSDSHIYNIVNTAYKYMTVNGKNQSILISGQSGAGKTQSTKIIIEYLIYLVNSLHRRHSIDLSDIILPKSETVSSKLSSDISIISYSSTNSSSTISLDEYINIGPLTTAQQEFHTSFDVSTVFNDDLLDNIVNSNPILESFGNAKTINNNNSSRFGKYIKIMFNNLDEIIGCNVETFLLEKVRVLSQYKEERNFHIFYEFIEGLNNNERAEFYITDIEKYPCIENDDVNSIQSKSDVLNFNKLITLLGDIGIIGDKKKQIYIILSFILNLSRCTFKFNLKILDILADLINNNIHVDGINTHPTNIESTYIYSKLYQRRLLTGGDDITIDLTETDFYQVRNSLCMKLYETLFEYIVGTVNNKINIVGNKYIGILDIFGFESLETNSFEQLCINYVNESLQSQFNKYTLQYSQHEYMNEGIKWDYVEYMDNQKCIDLIIGRPGILDILDDQCKVGGTSESYLNRMNNDAIFIDSPYYTYDNLKNNAFYINHYAGKIRYNTEHFCSKNKDVVNGEVMDIINKFTLFQSTPESVNTQQNSTIGSKSVSYQFKQHMRGLMDVIDKTNVHYVRCFKPNNINKSNIFNRIRILEQLNNNGILETIKVSRNCYPVKYTYAEFNELYLFNKYDNDRLLKPNIETDSLFDIFNPIESKKTVFMKQSVKKSQFNTGDFQFGKTKLFLKSTAFNILEQNRLLQLHKFATIIQSSYKGRYSRIIYMKICKSIKVIQPIIRGYISKCLYKQILYSIVKIQALFRRMRCIYIISALKIYHNDIIKHKLEQYRIVIKIQSIVRMRHQYNKYLRIKESWVNKDSLTNKDSYKLLDYSELLNKYITEIGDSIDKSNIIDELYEMNKAISCENKLLRTKNENLTSNNSKLEDRLNEISIDNKSYIECVKTNIEKRIELLYKMDEYKIKNEILARKFTDIYNRL